MRPEINRADVQAVGPCERNFGPSNTQGPSTTPLIQGNVPFIRVRQILEEIGLVDEKGDPVKPLENFTLPTLNPSEVGAIERILKEPIHITAPFCDIEVSYHEIAEYLLQENLGSLDIFLVGKRALKQELGVPYFLRTVELAYNTLYPEREPINGSLLFEAIIPSLENQPRNQFGDIDIHHYLVAYQQGINLLFQTQLLLYGELLTNEIYFNPDEVNAQKCEQQVESRAALLDLLTCQCPSNPVNLKAQLSCVECFIAIYLKKTDASQKQLMKKISPILMQFAERDKEASEKCKSLLSAIKRLN